jgi:lauroyl/myristoyl acyltransferase
MLVWMLFATGTWLAEHLPGRLLDAMVVPVALLLAHLPTAARSRLRRNLARASGLADERLNGLVPSVPNTSG